jgi:hypothetical protein
MQFISDLLSHFMFLEFTSAKGLHESANVFSDGKVTTNLKNIDEQKVCFEPLFW